MSLKSADTLRARVTHIWPVLLAWSARHWKWLTFLIWIAIAVAMVVSRWPAIHWLVLGDTDDNIRYVQVKDWLAGQGWYDLRQYRLDPPGGANIHWSRLVDIPIAGLILFFRAFVDQGLADRLACGIAPLLPLLLLVATLLALPLMTSASLTPGLLAVALALGLGWLAPAMFVERHRNARQMRLRAAFPDALDLMVVCVESGLALPQAIERVAEEMAVSQVELAEELATVNVELRAGISSAVALGHLAERTGLEDIRGLVSLLAQSIRFGTSVADTLRVYADEFRDRRTQAAEEQAAKIGTKLVFPLIFCLWPSFFLVAIGPAMIGVLKAFGGL